MPIGIRPINDYAFKKTFGVQAKTEDRMRYDAREKALRDQQWAIAAAHQAGELQPMLRGRSNS